MDSQQLVLEPDFPGKLVIPDELLAAFGCVASDPEYLTGIRHVPADLREINLIETQLPKALGLGKTIEEVVSET